MLHATQVAKYFIFKSIPGTTENITNLKLQKLLYFAQGHFLAKHGLENPLFDQEIKAWAHGPVVPEIYRSYSDYKFMEISKNGTENIDTEIERNYKLVLDEVWDKYKSFHGKDLEKITHEEGPWKEIRGDLPPFISTNITIPKKDIYEHFNTVTV